MEKREYDFETKWSIEKVEQILNEIEGLKVAHRPDGFYLCNFEFYGKKSLFSISVMKSCISLERPWISYWNGITSYKKLKEVMIDYSKEIKREIWDKLSFAEKTLIIAKKENNPEIITTVANMLQNNIRSNLHENEF